MDGKEWKEVVKLQKTLKPCPFCGSDAFLFEYQCGWVVSCQNEEEDDCHLASIEDMDLPNWFEMKVAVEKWNRRE